VADRTVLTVRTGIGPLALRAVGSDVFDRLGVAFARSTLVEIDPGEGEAARAKGDHMVVAGIRPDEIWLIGTRERVRALWSSLSAAPGFEHVHAVHLDPGIVTFHLAGPHACLVLEKICSLDWSEAMTPNGAAMSAGVAKVACDIVRADGYLGGSAPGFLIMCSRSYGRYLEECLIDAGEEFGVETRFNSLPN
jgi:sarcosine oxidase subunit gamma